MHLSLNQICSPHLAKCLYSRLATVSQGWRKKKQCCQKRKALSATFNLGTPIDLSKLWLLDCKQGSLRAEKLQLLSVFFLPACFVWIKGNWLAEEKRLIENTLYRRLAWWTSEISELKSKPNLCRMRLSGFGSVWPTYPFSFDQERVILTV